MASTEEDPTIRITSEGGVLPLQVEGTIGDPPNQRAFYFRERDGWDLYIAPPGLTIEEMWRAPASVPLGYYVGAERWEEPTCESVADAHTIIAFHARRCLRGTQE